MEETIRLDLNQSWEAIDIKTGQPVLIPKGSHQAIRMLRKSPPDQIEENYLVVAVQHEGHPVLAGLREAYWRQWEGHHIPEFLRDDPRNERETTSTTLKTPMTG